MDDISNKMISRAVELWCRKLLVPVFDNGDNSSTGGMSHILATINIQTDRDEIDNMAKRIDIFREVLTNNLIAMRDGDGYFASYLDVDYNPCKVLAVAADKAGIPNSQFSCKSSVSISPNKVSESFGYRCESKHHYPLPDGKWLITTLLGGDDEMDKVFTHVLNGNDMGLEVEG